MINSTHPSMEIKVSSGSLFIWLERIEERTLKVDVIRSFVFVVACSRSWFSRDRRLSTAFEEEAPSKRRFRENENACGYGKIAREREREIEEKGGKRCACGLGALARRPLLVVTCPVNRSISRVLQRWCAPQQFSHNISWSNVFSSGFIPIQYLDSFAAIEEAASVREHTREIERSARVWCTDHRKGFLDVVLILRSSTIAKSILREILRDIFLFSHFFSIS